MEYRIKTTAIIGSAIFSLAAQHASAEITYPIVDTGQTEIYDKLSGQDAHYIANAPSYKVNGDGTVSDLITRLMWTQNPGEKVTLSEAKKGALQCKIGGYSDWRLPSIKELYSLIQLNGTDPDPMSTEVAGLKPFIDASVFKFQYGDTSKNERIIDSQFATSTKYVSTTMAGNETMFGVNFADGRIKGYPVKNRRGEKTFFVLYVRNNPDYGKNKFKDNGDGTITDEATGLTWIKADSGKGLDWPRALEYAESLVLAGHSDWRLPNAKELQSIIDYTRSPDTTGSAAIDPIFSATEIKNEGGKKDYAHYWTNSTHIGARSTDTAVYFAFGRALGFMKDRRTGKTTLMDVHGAGAQRSDPKVGDASRFPQGRGPQGDVIRINNMVRCVRGGDVKTVKAETATIAPKRQGRQNERGQGRPGKDRQGKSGDFMAREDRNRDGKVSKAEFRGPAEHFDHLDKNSDGFITSDEAPSGPPPRNR